jgi:death-on-curing family protein
MLGAAYIERIHDVLVTKLWPGTDPIADNEFRNAAMLESAAARPFHSAGGEDAFPTIFEKAVALFHALNADHPFWNGNKRTAVIALDHFLAANEFFLAVPNDQMYALAEKTASYKKRGISHDQSMDEIASAIRERVIGFPAVLAAKMRNPKFEEFHDTMVKFSLFIRNDADNKIMDL